MIVLPKSADHPVVGSRMAIGQKDTVVISRQTFPVPPQPECVLARFARASPQQFEARPLLRGFASANEQHPAVSFPDDLAVDRPDELSWFHCHPPCCVGSLPTAGAPADASSGGRRLISLREWGKPPQTSANDFNGLAPQPPQLPQRLQPNDFNDLAFNFRNLRMTSADLNRAIPAPSDRASSCGNPSPRQ